MRAADTANRFKSRRTTSIVLLFPKHNDALKHTRRETHTHTHTHNTTHNTAG